MTSQLTSDQMSPEILKALQGSIAKWEKIAAGKGTDRGSSNCPLCQLFVEGPGGGGCKGCPVYERVMMSDCSGTPYSAWHLRNPWPRDSNGFVVRKRKATTDEHRKIAQAELDFLKTLLPKDAT